jgi:transcriptional regulator with XRE-family HTH domain
MTTAGPDVKQNEPGAFLRARRSELGPSDGDLPEGARQRRVAGLRREEVAHLAAISTDYYTRLEQGRIQPSAPVLASLARVLHLNEDQRTCMYELAGTPAKSRRRAPAEGEAIPEAFRAGAARTKGRGRQAHHWFR